MKYNDVNEKTKESIMTHIGKLEKEITWLAQYCHAPGCLDWGLCPEDCGCMRVKDLDTALAWRIYQECKQFKYRVYSSEWNLIDNLYRILQAEVIAYLNLLSYHQEKYLDLYWRLKNVGFELNFIWLIITKKLEREGIYRKNCGDCLESILPKKEVK